MRRTATLPTAIATENGRPRQFSFMQRRTVGRNALRITRHHKVGFSARALLTRLELGVRQSSSWQTCVSVLRIRAAGIGCVNLSLPVRSSAICSSLPDPALQSDPRYRVRHVGGERQMGSALRHCTADLTRVGIVAVGKVRFSRIARWQFLYALETIVWLYSAMKARFFSTSYLVQHRTQHFMLASSSVCQQISYVSRIVLHTITHTSTIHTLLAEWAALVSWNVWCGPIAVF